MEKATITEVFPRDGLQNIEKIIDTSTKAEIINKILDCGFKEIEVTSFVHPKAIPQLSDADEIFQKIKNNKNTSLRALVPNMKGLERAINANVDSIKFMLSATDSHSLSNANCTTKEAMDNFFPMVDRIKKNTDSKFNMIGSISVAFGCLYEGIVPVERLEKICKRYQEMGINEVSLADTNGVANPLQIKNIIKHLRKKFPDFSFSLHLHNTRGMAFANAVAGLEEGVTKFDSSVGGFGGCPYTPNASGNIASEDLINGFEEMGVSTGIDLDKVLNVAKYLSELIPEQVDSFLLKAGKPNILHKAPNKQKKIKK